ncbi:MAG TPA: mechanosensitive ion channel family protein [Terriglobales bacterium]|nr:mechanosensitive ion channel family protein [Terriglobales bacterium]
MMRNCNVFRRRTVAFLIISLFSVLALRAAPPSTADAQGVLSYLNQSIVWYHQLSTLQQFANEPSDILFLNDSRQIAGDVIQLSFDFARARAQVLSTQGKGTVGTDGQAPNAAQYQALTTLAAKMDGQVKELQGEIDDIHRKLDTASGKKRKQLEASLAETESEQQLAQARRDTLRTMLSFVSSAGAGVGGTGTLLSQINELARTVPVAATVEPTNGTATARPNQQNENVQVATATKTSSPNGIIDLVSSLMSLKRKTDALDNASKSTDQLGQTVSSMRAPLLNEIKQLASQGDQIAAQPDSTDPTVLAQQKQQLDAMTTRFKQASASMIPLGKQVILLDVYKRNLANWRESVKSEYRTQLKSLILRLVILGIVLAVIATVSEIWKRATFRYVPDVRRRYQFLLLRRIVVWIVIAIVIAAAFATELGTLATFAGLLTAGIAVALQNVILSVAGYFFLIGKYGVRVGDRVQVAGVTGDVIDVGLVRLHIMEVGTEGTDARATGRVVVFSNAVVFQPNAGLFKQIPGTSFVWHDISLTLAPESNYQDVEKRLMEAINSVYDKYKDVMETQRRRMEQSLGGLTVRPLHPDSRLRLTQTGLEVVIRYPVELGNAPQIDDDMARALLSAVAKSPRLRLVGSGTPNIQAVVENQPA